MKIVSILTCILPLFLFSRNVTAQQKTPNQGKAIYQVVLNYNEIPIRYDGELIFNERASLFVYDKDTYEEEYDVEKREGGQIRRIISKGRSTDDIGLVIYTDFVHDKIVERNLIDHHAFIVSDTLHSTDWTLLDETKDIDGIRCQKATATVYGREYEVWFSNTIALPYGPWKLRGLPGLILEARSTDSVISFELKEYLSSVEDAQHIAPPTAGEAMEGYANFYALEDKKVKEWEMAFRARVAELQQSKGLASSVTHHIGAASVNRIEKSSTF